MAATYSIQSGSSAGSSAGSGAQSYQLDPSLGPATATESANLASRYNSFTPAVLGGYAGLFNQAQGLTSQFGQTQSALTQQLFDQQRAASQANDMSLGVAPTSKFSGATNPAMTQQEGLVLNDLGAKVDQQKLNVLGSFGNNYYGNMSQLEQAYNQQALGLSQQYLGALGRQGTTSYENMSQNQTANQGTSSGVNAVPGQGVGAMPGMPPMQTSTGNAGGGGGGYNYGSGLGPAGNIPLPSGGGYPAAIAAARGGGVPWPNGYNPAMGSNPYSQFQGVDPNQIGQVDDQGYFMGD